LKTKKRKFKSAREQNEEYRTNERTPVRCYCCDEPLGGTFATAHAICLKCQKTSDELEREKK
jgi:hypothetical protein